ncbi:MAG: dihydrolipoamide acetyltransferase family protein [Roseateles asaccharophilus]|uniref:Dihydrolipoamide acetyltransferase component of pyruvate dehydrogenase complex n=1 Tax=Roseateles asaccharophilus TaxID=582607 RepID=A0A4R6N696_9BURK|nr:dihydrolipoamide acetyltransferase family protein [Roseateles asaccharophilus]MDN3544453.1 dihydrolipoamide acetyltransferase family protein [Roseateles asaccharophilus]TDP09782.1 2-oxoisovalerate dehydrogenase E2 component (dihydrolipoyl transacylase) [Roseateles asaccharophilus]
MAAYVIKMPDIGEGIAEVELVAWRVQPGEAVAEDQILADVMTDKATVEIPSPVAGTVVSHGGTVGQVMAVGAELIRLEVEGAGNVRSGGDAAPVQRSEAAPAVAPAIAATAAARVDSAQAAAPKSAAGPASAAARPLVAPRRAADEKPIASPAVRRRAWDLGIELQFVPGTGPAGRITQDDLEAFAASGGAASAAGREVDSRYALRLDEQAVPVIGLRRKIAQKMQQAKRQIPHFTYVEEVDVTELEALRQRLNAEHAARRAKLTLLPFLARAVVIAVREFPQVNARFDDEAQVLTRYGAVHLGMATQTEAGLLVPVIRHAETLDPWACAGEIARLADAARKGKASREELGGSTITITSLGALGGIVTTPVINHPEVGIVGVNRMVERPMFDRDGRVVPRLLMNLSASFDHRVVDGMDAALFVQRLRALLETPATLFIE